MPIEQSKNKHTDMENCEALWELTDPDCAQCRKKDTEYRSTYHFIQINELDRHYGVVAGAINLTDYTKEELKNILSAYDWALDEAEELIAEAVFETECLEYAHLFYDSWNQAIHCVEEYTKLDLNELREHTKDKMVSLKIYEYIEDDFSPSKRIEFTITQDALQEYLDEIEYEESLEVFLTLYNSDDSMAIYNYMEDDNRILNEQVSYADDVIDMYDEYKKQTSESDLTLEEFYLYEYTSDSASLQLNNVLEMKYYPSLDDKIKATGDKENNNVAKTMNHEKEQER